MFFLYSEYGPILIFLIIRIVLACIILGLSSVIAIQNPDSEKVSAYECGFDPFGDARATFDVRFYLVAILFILFDLEAAFYFHGLLG
jgi:NADH-quinone oxidoreductase subunit A